MPKPVLTVPAVKPIPRPVPRPRPVIAVPVTLANPLAGTGGIKPDLEDHVVDVGEGL